MAEIVLDKVTKRFADGTEAVHEADFTIADGEFFILVGPSGCGKSTLLNMIVGLEDISDGELRVDGEVVNGIDPKDRNMAMVFQSYAIYPHMTVRENMAFPLKLAKRPKEEIAKKVDEVAEVLELTELLDRKPANLSGGQRQRVAMGRAIVREPAAFLMDEPLSNLDAKLRVQMRIEISRLQSDLGTTTVYVTHDQTEAMTLGDRVAVMRKGVVQQVGTPRELYHQPVNIFVAGFIGSPAMNFLPAHLDGDTLDMPVGQFRLPPEVRDRLVEGADGGEAGEGGRRVIAGIRPENFEDLAFVADDLREHGPTFSVEVDVVEWMGSELYAYFHLDKAGIGELADLAEDLDGVDLSADDLKEVVGRLDVSSEVAEGQSLEVWLDARHLHLFDPDTGESLLSPDEHSDESSTATAEDTSQETAEKTADETADGDGPPP